MGVPPDQFVNLFFDRVQIGSLLESVGIVPRVAEDEPVHAFYVFANLEPTFSESLKLVRFFCFDGMTLATRHTVARRRRKR